MTSVIILTILSTCKQILKTRFTIVYTVYISRVPFMQTLIGITSYDEKKKTKQTKQNRAKTAIELAFFSSDFVLCCCIVDVVVTLNILEPLSVDEDDSQAFSPAQSNQIQGKFVPNNVTSQKKTADLHELPHELRRQKRLEREQLYFKRMTEQINQQEHGECTIERVHRPSRETFLERYMRPRKPAILTGMMDSLEATNSWDFDQLGKRRESHRVAV